MKKILSATVIAGITLVAAGFGSGAHADDPTARHAAEPFAQAAVPDSEKDQTLHAMHDEMERSRTRLQIEGVDKPYYVEYRLLDLDVKTITSSFGSLIASNTNRNRFMSIDVRIGDYHLDSSNFITEDGFQGFLGTTGEVGIDRDYNSLRQDLWLSTDQAYKQAATQLSLKQAFLRSLTKPPEIDDFSQATPLVQVDPRPEVNWTTRKWEDEARVASAVLKNYPELNGARVNYYMAYVTYYLMNSEGTTIRTSRSIGAVEAAMDSQADDGMPLHNFYSLYVASPQDMPSPDLLAKSIAKAAEDLVALRKAPIAPDYTGPVLFDAPAAGSLLAQALSPSLSGARPPLSMLPAFDEMMERMGGRSEWSGRVGTRVLAGERFARGRSDDEGLFRSAPSRRLRNRRRGRERPARRDRAEWNSEGRADVAASRSRFPGFERARTVSATFRYPSTAKQLDFLGHRRPQPYGHEEEIPRCLQG